MTLGRMVNYFIPGQRFFRISARRFGTIFVCLDIFAFLVQATGAVFTSQQNASVKTTMMGVHIYMGGIGLQEVFILCFTALAIQLHKTMIQMERKGESIEKLSNCVFPWRWLFYSIYFALGMITVSPSIAFPIETQTNLRRSVLFSALDNMRKERQPRILS